MKSRIQIKKSRRFLLATLAALSIALIGWIYTGNTAIGITHYSVSSPDLPEDFDPFIIAQVSDLHNDNFGENQKNLINAIEKSSPDMIVVTGDLIDSRKPDVEIAMDFIRQAMELAPVYYATGNHESRIPEEYGLLESQMIAEGVHVLRDQQATVKAGNGQLQIIGLEDPDFNWYLAGEDAGPAIQEKLSGLMEENLYTILLSHRPELFQAYSAAGADLVFTGHAHGGQFRIPFIGGVAAPDQGFFPDYSEGIHQQNSTTMVVSRGLGNSIFPFRLNNPPELVVVTLKKE
jgi:predicted MPP superfamily phosphohydrolase